MPTAGGLVMLNRIKQGFSAPEGIWKCSPSLLCQGTLFSHSGSHNRIWGSLTQDIAITQNSGGSFCHLHLCNKIYVAEWQLLVGRWLKYLSRARAFPAIILHAQVSSAPEPLLKEFTDLKLRRLSFLGWWGHPCHICLCLQFLAPVSGTFNNSLMNECFGSQVTIKSLSCIICLHSLFSFLSHPSSSCDQPGMLECKNN